MKRKKKLEGIRKNKERKKQQQEKQLLSRYTVHVPNQ